MGIDTHLPLAYRYAPIKYQGLNSLNIEDKQFIEKLKLFLFHINTTTQLAQLIKTNLESLQLILGTHHHIFQLPYNKYGILAPTSWITHLWEMSYKYNITITGQYTKLHPIRKNDQALMDMIIESNTFTPDEIIKINYCRIYLQVYNLSDITNGFGTNINHCILQHIKNPDTTSSYNWPHQPNPSRQSWKIWDEAINTIWSHSEQNKLHTPLGLYIRYPSFQSPWLYQENSETLFYKISTISYSIYKKTNQRNIRHSKGINFTLQSFTFIQPINTKYAIVNRIDLKHVNLEHIIDEQHFQKHHHPIHNEIDIFFDQVQFPDDINPLLQQISKGNAIAVSDASVLPDSNTGASSFIISTDDIKCVCTGSHGVPRGSEPMDSYRAELYGILSILYTLHEIHLNHNIRKGTITIACDNKASLENALNHNTRVTTTKNSHDILWAIHEIKNNLPINIIPQHVKGHQDQNILHSLTLAEKLNCYTDEKAKIYRKK